MTAPETDLALMRIFQTRAPECLKCCWEQANVLGLIGSDRVLAFKFSFSILTQIQDHDRSQKIRKMEKKYVPISDFATRLLNLRKPEKSKKFSKKNIFFC